MYIENDVDTIYIYIYIYMVAIEHVQDSRGIINMKKTEREE